MSRLALALAITVVLSPGLAFAVARPLAPRLHPRDVSPVECFGRALGSAQSGSRLADCFGSGCREFWSALWASSGPSRELISSLSRW